MWPSPSTRASMEGARPGTVEGMKPNLQLHKCEVDQYRGAITVLGQAASVNSSGGPRGITTHCRGRTEVAPACNRSCAPALSDRPEPAIYRPGRLAQTPPDLHGKEGVVPAAG